MARTSLFFGHDMGGRTTPPDGVGGIARHSSALHGTPKESPGKLRAKMEAGGIEPRTRDLQVLLRQALTRVGEEGLASCLASLCSDEDLALVVEAWPGLPASCKRLMLDAVSERGAQ